jgi:mannose-6-phosphate isomerase
VGELWLAGPASVVQVGTDGPRTLDELAAEVGDALVGSAGLARYGARFPLLAKLIDASDWLSLQLHPDDALARELSGPKAIGKAEAWVVLDAAPEATLIVGPADGLSETELRSAIASGTAGREHCREVPAVAGDVLLVRPGTLHAIGGGIFLYELQQPSDLTYRVSDWGRSGRALHIDASLRALHAGAHAEACGHGFRIDGGTLEIPELRLELPAVTTPIVRHPAGRSPEVVTAIRGSLRLTTDGWSETLATRETVVVPAAVAAYELAGVPEGMAAIGSLP